MHSCVLAYVSIQRASLIVSVQCSVAMVARTEDVVLGRRQRPWLSWPWLS